MAHRAPSDDGYAAPLHALDRLLPTDVYDNPRLYDWEISPATIEMIGAARGNPDLLVTVYRAVPDGVEAINPGDWVSVEHSYAAEHGFGQGPGGRDWVVLSMQVPAGTLFSEGNDLKEYGWDPTTRRQ